MTKLTKVSKEKFKAYLKVQKTGVTNMFNVYNVMEAAKIICDVELTKEDCFCIMKNYKELKEMYK